MTDPMELVGRLESNAPLPICPYDRRSPEYWTTNDTDPCKFCGTKNEEGAPDLCRGADTRLFTEAAACIREMVEWRPIETAPRDGTVILGWSSFFPKRRPVEVAWDADRYALRPVPRWVARDSAYSRRAFFDHPLTHWLPLPPAPGAEA